MKFRHLPVQNLEDVTADLEQLQPELTSTGAKVAALETKVAAVEAKVAAVETKLADTGWVTIKAEGSGGVAFTNGFKASGVAGFAVPAYRKQGNTVRLRGLMGVGTENKSAFTLPEGFRPTAHQVYSVGTGSTAKPPETGKATVESTGPVVMAISGSAFIALDNVTFTID